MKDQFEPLAIQLVSYCQKQLGFKRPPKLFLKQDEENALNSFGTTGQYNPENEEITVFFAGRHIKDVLRSLSHELVHHHQNLRGDLTSDKCGSMGPGYAQNNKHMRNMEKEAYLIGNMIFRDWEDSCKNKNLKENKQMSTKTKLTKQSLQSMINESFSDKLEESCGCPDLVQEMRQAIADSPRKQKKITNTIFKRVAKRILSEMGHMGASYGRDEMAYGRDEMAYGRDEMAYGRDEECPEGMEKNDDGECVEKEDVPGSRSEVAYGRDEVGIPGVGLEENRAKTPEQASLIYEQRFQNRDSKLFDKLLKKWAK